MNFKAHSMSQDVLQICNSSSLLWSSSPTCILAVKLCIEIFWLTFH